MLCVCVCVCVYVYVCVCGELEAIEAIQVKKVVLLAMVCKRTVFIPLVALRENSKLKWL